MNRQVYLDHNASTPVHPEVRRRRCCRTSASASAIRRACTASAARRARASRPRASRSPASSGSARRRSCSPPAAPSPTTWRSRAWRWPRGRGHLITSQIEHHAVLRACEWLETQGFAVTYLDVDGYGMVDPDDVRRAIRPDTIRISIMHANSEIGHHPAHRGEIGAIAHERGIPFHVDAVQTFGKVADRPRRLRHRPAVVLGHKIYGPKGIAGLWIRKGTKMVSVQHGGDHERRRRAGTENVPGIVGLRQGRRGPRSRHGRGGPRVTAAAGSAVAGSEARVPDVRLNGHRPSGCPAPAT